MIEGSEVECGTRYARAAVMVSRACDDHQAGEAGSEA